MGGGSFVPTQGYWRFAADADPPSVFLANENVKPVLTSEAIIRLIINIIESGGAAGSGVWVVQYREGTGGTWTALGASNHWNWANGASTEGAAHVFGDLSDTNSNGEVIETPTFSSSVSKNKSNEFDLSIQPVSGNYTPGTDYYFRVLTIGGTSVNAGPSLPVVTTMDTSQSATPNGIGSSESVGTPTAIPGGVTATPDGIGTSESVGTPTAINEIDVTPEGIASSESVGVPTVVVGGVYVTPDGIASSEDVGIPTATGGDEGVTAIPDSIGSSESVGEPTALVQMAAVPVGIASSESVGEPTVLVGPVVVTPDGIASSEDVGTPAAVPNANATPDGIGSSENVGQPTVVLGSVFVTPDGIPSAAQMGVPTATGGVDEAKGAYRPIERPRRR